MDAARREITRRVMKAMRHESGRRPLVPGRDGSFPVVIALSEDSVGMTAHRVRQAGGVATVVLPDDAHHVLVPLTWRFEAEEDLLPASGPIHPESSMGMLLIYLAHSQDDSMTFHITTPDGGVAVKEQVDGINVPA